MPASTAHSGKRPKSQSRTKAKARAPSPVRRLYLFGCKVCDFFANVAGHPAAIIVLAAACLAWIMIAGEKGQDLLTLILSILAITLTQMVLNQQRRNEQALHLKIDELLIALEGPRNHLAGIEAANEDTIKAAKKSHGSR